MMIIIVAPVITTPNLKEKGSYTTIMRGSAARPEMIRRSETTHKFRRSLLLRPRRRYLRDRAPEASSGQRREVGRHIAES